VRTLVEPRAMAEGTGDVESAIDALYGLVPSAFTAARNELAKALRKEKRKDDAARVAKLPKPTAAAWALNQIARTRPDLVSALLREGAQLRLVQDRVLAGQAEPSLLQRASDERRRAIRDIVSAMGDTLEPGEARRTEEWVRTLEAASVDDRLGQLLTSGRFATVVLEGVGFDGLLAGPDPAPRHLKLVPPLRAADEPGGRAGTEPAGADSSGPAEADDTGRDGAGAGAEDSRAEAEAARAQAQAQAEAARAEEERRAQRERAAAARAEARRVLDAATAVMDDASHARQAEQHALEEAERAMSAIRARLEAALAREAAATQERADAAATLDAASAELSLLTTSGESGG
jgi:hypothetical protein